MTWMENTGGFQHLWSRECQLHPSAVLNKWFYFKAWVSLFIAEQTAECERNVLSKQRHWPQLCLKWDRRPEDSFHRSEQKVLANICVWVWMCGCLPLQPTPKYLATTLLVLLTVDTQAHTETLKSKQLHSDFLFPFSCIETLTIIKSTKDLLRLIITFIHHSFKVHIYGLGVSLRRNQIIVEWY